jgi:hypothetical protein
LVRGFLILLLTLIAFEVSGLAALCGDPPCNEDCPTDASGGECAPNCHLCRCCSLPSFTKPASLAINPALLFRRSGWIQGIRTPSAPDPTAILHVPKLLLA